MNDMRFAAGLVALVAAVAVAAAAVMIVLELESGRRDAPVPAAADDGPQGALAGSTDAHESPAAAMALAAGGRRVR
jgi:hypothetical protein